MPEPQTMTDDEAFMVLAAVRYAVGRKSYAPCIVMDEVRRLLPKMPTTDLTLLAKDIRSDVKDAAKYGGCAYGDAWLALAADAETEFQSRSRAADALTLAEVRGLLVDPLPTEANNG